MADDRVHCAANNATNAMEATTNSTGLVARWTSVTLLTLVMPTPQKPQTRRSEQPRGPRERRPTLVAAGVAPSIQLPLARPDQLRSVISTPPNDTPRRPSPLNELPSLPKRPNARTNSPPAV